MNKFFIFIMLMFSCELFAQENYDVNIRLQYEQINQLFKDIDEVKGFIAVEKEKLYNLKLSWYQTCVGYLSEGNLKPEDLDKLISQTRIEIDGEDLYNELARAKKTIADGETYKYNNVNPPSKESSGQKKDKKDKKKRTVPKDDSSKKDEKKNPEGKNPEQKEKKEPKQPVEETKTPATPVATPEVKDKPIESDPNKDKPGDEKVIVETPVKNENPPVEPEAPKKSEPVAPVKKTPKKADKGEMEEGMSKKAKNNDGSN